MLVLPPTIRVEEAPRRQIKKDGILYREVRDGDDDPQLPRWVRYAMVGYAVSAAIGGGWWIRIDGGYMPRDWVSVSLVGVLCGLFSIMILVVARETVRYLKD